MAIIVSILLSLVAGVNIMYQNKYFWGKESNSNINTMNCTFNALTDTVGTFGVILIAITMVAALAFVAFLCSCRGF